jgi:hypothetical protein
MVLRIIADDHDASPFTSARRLQSCEEFPETLGVEATCLPAMEKSSIAEPHGAKVSHAPPCGVVVHNGVFGFWRHPHAATRTMLLKVHLVESPQVHGWIAHQFL